MFGIVWFTLVASGCSAALPQENVTPASFLEPRNFNYHPYQLRQYLEESKPTKQGPVLFPNDGPPATRGPLIVTARPLLESIANSDINPNPPNNSITQNPPTTQSNVPLSRVYPLPSPTDVTLSPELLANISPISNNNLFGSSGEVAANNVPEASSYSHVPYAEMLSKARLKGYIRENSFNEYEERTVLPPIYRALSDYARQNLFKQKPTNQYNYVQNLDYGTQFDKKSSKNSNEDYDQDQSYAFSYTVSDQKTGDDFSHKQRTVSGGTNGEYRVRLPDGRMQIVSYTADENGYKADVRYDDDDKNVANDNNKATIVNDNDRNAETNYIKPNNINNNIKQYDNNAFNNNANPVFNNIRQYDNQYFDGNYFQSQNDQRKQYHDRVLVNDYIKVPNQNNDIKQYDNLNLRNDYITYKDVIPNRDDSNQYNSKEYYDYSSEYSQNYEPYNSKFAIYNQYSSPAPIVSTIRPTYSAKPIYTIAPSQIYSDGVISASNNPLVKYETTTENLVLIGGKKVYTNINHVLPKPSTTARSPFASVSPAAYLASTIASLRERVTAKPVGFGNILDRISKYLTFK